MFILNRWFINSTNFVFNSETFVIHSGGLVSLFSLINPYPPAELLFYNRYNKNIFMN